MTETAYTALTASFERLHELFLYDAEKGTLRRRSPRQKENPCGCGSLNSFGHRQVRVEGVLCVAHVVIWVMMTGKMPHPFIDHVNGVPSDNRWENLREATRQQNGWNQKVRKTNKLGIKGVRYRSGRFDARISKGGITLFLGSFKTAKEAEVAYQEKAKELFGRFACDSNHSPLCEVA